MFNTLKMPPADALHGLMARYQADPRSDKVDLGVGVYYNRDGLAPVMAAASKAEELNLQEQTTKSYLGLAGVEDFISNMTTLAFGPHTDRPVAAVQTLGGTGGVRQAIELAKHAKSDLKVHIGTPTWPNHFTICEMLGVEAVPFQYFDVETQTLRLNEFRDTIASAAAGDIVIFHGPCHNPSGQDLSHDELDELLTLAAKRGVVPLVDAAYYGLGGDLDEDLNRLRNQLQSIPNAFLVMSCSKAFGLYRDRTGIVFALCENAQQKDITTETFKRIGRGNYSMPPAPGANTVARILKTPELEKLWQDELQEMRLRVRSAREELYNASHGHPVFASVLDQKGIFSLLPINSETVGRLIDNHGIYLPASGRINVAGLKKGDAEKLCNAVIAELSN